MTLARLRPQLVQWFGVFGGPFAWATQHVAGVIVTLAACDRSLSRSGPVAGTSGIAVDAVTTTISAVCALITLAAGAAALYSLRETRGVDKSDPPPEGRRHFLALVGVAITPLFFAMIVMNSSGVLHLAECRQS